MKIYLDTNIYIDYLENRTDKLRPLGEFAFQCFKQSLSCEFFIVFSDHVLNELISVGVSVKEINEIKKWIESKLIIVKRIHSDNINAHKIMKEFNIHKEDAFHYVIALREADKILTNDNQFKKLPLCIGYESL